MPDEKPIASNRRRAATSWAAREFKRFVVMFLYLWVLLALFVLNETVILRQRGIDFAPHGFALINALILAKVMLVAEELDLGDRLRPRPLIYPIVLEALILSVLFTAFCIVEKVIVGLIEGDTFATSVPVVGGGRLKGLVCVAMILFVSLVPFFAFRRVSRELGPGRMRAMMLGVPAAPAAAATSDSA
ncbi:hypothetical protein SAMN02990966_00275 [Rhodospirillales bacterium URHD0017]|nr:hypothetical protein SAMN02990966_00275 [Rhodospirillales bacterium URHD0017]